jgi:hypothetical protein
MTFEPVPILFFRLIWDGHHVHFPLRINAVNMKELHVVPETAHPFGRKGLALAGAWGQLATPETAGLLILDGDVVIDPHDYVMMWAAIQKEPTAVHIGPTRLWPVSKNDLDGWAWGHCRDNQFSQVMEMNPDFFAFNFTYVPRRVIELAVKAGLKNTQYPGVDKLMSRTARQAGVPMRVVEDCQPKHLHY